MEQNKTDLLARLSKQELEHQRLTTDRDLLRDQVSDLQAKLKSSNQSEDASAEQNSALESDLKKSAKLNENLRNQIGELERQLAEAGRELEVKLKETRELLEQDLKELRQENVEKENDIIDMGEKLQDAFSVQEGLEKEKERVETELKQRISGLEEQLEEERSRIAVLQVKIFKIF